MVHHCCPSNWGLHVLFCGQRLPPTFAFPQYPRWKYRPDDGTVCILTHIPEVISIAVCRNLGKNISPFKKKSLTVPHFCQTKQCYFVLLSGWNFAVFGRISHRLWAYKLDASGTIPGVFGWHRGSGPRNKDVFLTSKKRENVQKTASLDIFCVYI